MIHRRMCINSTPLLVYVVKMHSRNYDFGTYWSDSFPYKNKYNKPGQD